jgi:protein involved in polysaccharide export with SLBB domain
MMKRFFGQPPALICLMVGGWAVLGGMGRAQMSTFPSPPPVPAPARSTPDPSANNAPANAPAGAEASPDGGNAAAGAAPGPSVPEATSTNNNGAAPVTVTAETLTSMSALDDKDTLSPGDLISFRVIEDRDPAVPRMVTDTGEVDFPYVGRLKVEGMTCYQVAVALKKLLEVDYYKQATVIVGLDVIANHPHNVAVTNDVVWLIGQVRSVGPQTISPLHPTTVSQVILRAGGFGDFADQRKVRLIHRASLPNGTAGAAPPVVPDDDSGQKGEIVDVKAVFDGNSTVDPVVQPNDYIIVPKRFINF